MRTLLILAALAVSVHDSYGGWGAGGCGPVGSVARVAPPASEWLEDARNPNLVGLYRGGVQVGVYIRSTGKFYDLLPDGTFSKGRKIGPCGCKAGCACDICKGDCNCAERGPCSDDCGCVPITTAAIENFGVYLDKKPAVPVYRINGKEVSREAAMEAIEKGGLVDDSHKRRLTIIGSEDERKKVLADLTGPLAPLASDLLVQAYPPDNFAVHDAGFRSSGHPTIYLQAPDGKVLHRQDDYQDGAEGLAKAIRKADPNYDASKDKDQRKDAAPFGLSWGMIGAIAAVLLAILKR